MSDPSEIIPHSYFYEGVNRLIWVDGGPTPRVGEEIVFESDGSAAGPAFNSDGVPWQVLRVQHHRKRVVRSYGQVTEKEVRLWLKPL